MTERKPARLIDEGKAESELSTGMSRKHSLTSISLAYADGAVKWRSHLRLVARSFRSIGAGLLASLHMPS
ncbi:hypothetical protein [uncultured Bradyrhizobium sp.]|uniref:hypothetical protein n=1 Tax=Bradyrhizobium sp. TaxID=376 RepID=UPI002608600E|nr:hypothetical protein [uncultured Bradyrhizobium sp.]